MENFSQNRWSEKGLNCCGLECLFDAFVGLLSPLGFEEQYGEVVGNAE